MIHPKASWAKNEAGENNRYTSIKRDSKEEDG